MKQIKSKAGKIDNVTVTVRQSSVFTYIHMLYTTYLLIFTVAIDTI